TNCSYRVFQNWFAFSCFLLPLSPSRFGLKWSSGSKLMPWRSLGLCTIFCTSSSLRVALVTGGSNCGAGTMLGCDVGGKCCCPSGPGVRAGRYSACGLEFELVEHVEGFLDSPCAGPTTRAPRFDPLWLSF